MSYSESLLSRLKNESRRWQGGFSELFAVGNDSFEVTNLIGDSAYSNSLAAMREALAGAKAATGYVIPSYAG